MEFKIEDYTPINWKNWIFGGRGENIKPPFVSERQWELWKQIPFFEDIKAIKYIENFPAQDAREDPGQGELVTYLSKKLLAHIPGQEDVVILAAMLHDTGYTIDPQEFREAFLNIPENEDPKITKLKQLKIRLEHQVRGANHAYNLLTRLNWNPAQVSEVMRIILDHDTRILPPTPNGSIMQDADILWRFTVPCLQAYHSNESCEGLLDILEKRELALPDRFYHDDISRPIARLELANSLLYLHPGEAEKALQDKGYKKELEMLA